MANGSQGIRHLDDEELQSVRGGLFGWLKKAAKWAKEHIVIGLHSIGIKGKF